VKKIIQQHWRVPVYGRNYPPGLVPTLLSRATTAVQMIVIALAVGGDSLFSALRVPPPSFYPPLKENRWAAGAGAWMMGNILSANLLNTGAFEIKYGERMVFSKLEQGRMPSVGEVLAGLEKEMELHLGDESIRDFAVGG